MSLNLTHKLFGTTQVYIYMEIVSDTKNSFLLACHIVFGTNIWEFFARSRKYLVYRKEKIKVSCLIRHICVDKQGFINMIL